MKALFAVAALVLATGTAAAQDREGAPPERDARGIPVISAEPTVPPGVNQTVTAPPGATFQYSTDTSAFASRPATEEYVPCTRERTDNCVQAYVGNRSSTRPRRGRR